jgi:ribosomal protein L21E
MSRATTKLRYGPYRSPCYQLGERVDCLCRGEVTIWQVSDGRVPWPIGKKGSALSLVLCGDLIQAVKRESAAAVRYWWGVSGSVVWHWRRALGIRITEGDRAVRRHYMTPSHNRKMTCAATRVANSPARRRKISAARLGQPRSPATREKLRLANLGKTLSQSTRQKMSETHRRRGTHPPAAGVAWTAYETRMLDQFTPAEVARRTGRTIKAVYAARKRTKLR